MKTENSIMDIVIVATAATIYVLPGTGEDIPRRTGPTSTSLEELAAGHLRGKRSVCLEERTHRRTPSAQMRVGEACGRVDKVDS